MPCILRSRYHDKHHHGNQELHHQPLQGWTYCLAPSTGEQGQQTASSSQLLWGLTQLQGASMSEARPLWEWSTLVTEQVGLKGSGKEYVLEGMC